MDGEKGGGMRAECSGDDMNASISIVLPVYNGARFVERCLSSVLAQSFRGWELLVVDDASTDESNRLLFEYEVRDPRICVFQLNENRGPSAARNLSLRHAQGEMICYLDCDDEFYPDHLERVYAWRNEADVLVFAYDAVDEGVGLFPAGEVRTWDPALLHDRLMERNIAAPLGVAHRRSLLDRVGGFDEAIYHQEEWDLWKRFARSGASFLFLAEKSGLYHIRPDSQSSTARVPEAISRERKVE